MSWVSHFVGTIKKRSSPPQFKSTRRKAQVHLNFGGLGLFFMGDKTQQCAWMILDKMHSMAVMLRSVEETDVPSMAAIRALEWGSFWTDRISRYLNGQHSPQQALPARTVFVAIEGSDLVGFVAGHKTRRLGCDGELQWINVAKEKRGMGVAGQLMTKIGMWFVAQDARRICVNVDPANLTARRLYTGYGAQILNDQWMIWADARAMCISVDV